jgi:hypothetical protein
MAYGEGGPGVVDCVVFNDDTSILPLTWRFFLPVAEMGERSGRRLLSSVIVFPNLSCMLSGTQ